MSQIPEMTILIGKEPGQGRLLLSARVNGQPRIAFVDAPGSVPASVSRCKVAEGVAHCSLTIDKSGNMILKNLKDQNVTYVNDQPILSKRVTADSHVSLGNDRYPVSVAQVIAEAAKWSSAPARPAPGERPGRPEPKSYSVSHLEDVWNGYKQSLKDMQSKSKRVNLIRTGCGLFTMCTMPLSMAIGPIAYALTGVGFCGTLYSFIYMKNDNSDERKEQLTENFQDNYVCPNPECGRFLGNMSYRQLRKQITQCPKCHCTYTD